MTHIAILTPTLTSADAVSNDVLAMERLLNERGHEVRLFAENSNLTTKQIQAPPAALSYLRAPEDVLIYHHSIGWDSGIETVKRASGRKIIKYHNVTPPEFFEGVSAEHQRLCERGRAQLKDIVECQPDLYLAAMQEGPAKFWLQFGVEWLGWIFTTLPFGVAVYLCVVGIEHATRYFIDAREREVQVARLSEQLSSARFAALQAQLNPHFLFNTLNTITVLVRDNDRRGAVTIIEHLSELLRRTLSRHQANEVTLGEELDLVQQYVAIEQARFSDRLRPEFRIPESLMSAVIPSFALQHLVENAIRHGIAKHTDAGLLLVIANRAGNILEISVIDDGTGIDPAAPLPPGHGIDNTRERLRALYGESASLEISPRPEGGTIATLRLPYRELRPEPNGETS